MIVTAPVGSTVTATKDGKTKTATENNGVFTFKGLEAGEWTVTATKGSQTASKLVTVSAETTALTFKPVASTAATSGVSYTAGLAGVSAEDVSLFADAISNNSAITNTTSVVYIDYGDTIHRKISVGDQVTLSLNGTNYVFDIIGFNHDALTDANAYGFPTATGKAGITLQMHDCFATTYSMGSGNVWKSCTMRTSTLVTLKGYLPNEWEAVIKPVNKVTAAGGGSSALEPLSESCFLLAEVEVFGSASKGYSGEGSQYAYYRAGNSKGKKKGSSDQDWRLRSPQNGSSTQYCIVLSWNGSVSVGSAGSSGGVAFAFCV